MRSPKKNPVSKSRKRSKFKITNWPYYNNSLHNRGCIDFMISQNLSDDWYADKIGAKKRVGQQRYSDSNISANQIFIRYEAKTVSRFY